MFSFVNLARVRYVHLPPRYSGVLQYYSLERTLVVMSSASCGMLDLGFLSHMYICISLNTSGASFFTTLSLVLIIGFWITSYKVEIGQIENDMKVPWL